MQGRLPGTHAECVDSAFERRDALLEHVIGWVVYSGVTVPFDFEIEQRRSMFGAIECERDRLIDRNRDRPGRRIAVVTAVNGKRFASEMPWFPARFRG